MICIDVEHLKQIKQNDITGLTLYLVHFVILEDCHFAPMWKTLVWQHLIKRGGLLLINIAYLVPSQKGEWSCICLLRWYLTLQGDNSLKSVEPEKWTVMYLFAKGVDLSFFYDFEKGCRYCMIFSIIIILQSTFLL